ncbi:uncharacterized protein N7506_000968 [Penicillium brevicompactum]|uniref:uncharacterized protein n=1 Tax=Penicillium brevicompactum TaxID=5074 RepID=UPI002540835C|nr:uncharacterized protein N7506_000968 [Penicillium brevicompactum]KAJ5347715.1 hypothetical protein N7506_000968 [Penicillium brevicompactum]
MSFGFSIGDFITVIEKTNQLRKDFIGAPPQFKAISDELRNLEIVIRDLEVDQHNTHLNAKQKQELQDIASSCRTLFNEIDTLLSRYCEIDAARPIKRTWKRLRWEPEDVHDLRNRLSSNISILNAFNGRITRDTISMLLEHKTDETQRVCLDWLSPTTHAARQSEYLRLLQPGTGQWLLQSQNFLSWIDEPGKTMFCPGIPGAGKTILSSAVIDEIESRYSSNPEIGIAYIYCDFQHTSDGSQKPESFLSSIIRQLVLDASPMPSVVQAMYDKHEPKGTRPTFAELSKAFSVVCRSFKRWFLVFDALDECNLSDAIRTLDAIISYALHSNMSLFATSRFIPEIMSKFQDDTMTQEIRAEKSDIAKYLTANLDQLPSFVSRNKQLQQEVIDVITNAADGM